MKLSDITIKNMFYFCQGYLRSFVLKYKLNKMKKELESYCSANNWENCLSNSGFSFTQEQFFIRWEKVLNNSPKCIASQCWCGCATPELFLSDKGCEGYEKAPADENITKPCYDKMLSESEWKEYKIKNNRIK